MKYVTTSVLSFGAGALLGLTKAQAGRRQHALAPVPDREDWYTAIAPIQLKRGEEFLYEGDLPKSMVSELEWEGKADEKPSTSAETKAQRRAREKAPAGGQPS